MANEILCGICDSARFDTLPNLYNALQHQHSQIEAGVSRSERRFQPRYRDLGEDAANERFRTVITLGNRLTLGLRIVLVQQSK